MRRYNLGYVREETPVFHIKGGFKIHYNTSTGFEGVRDIDPKTGLGIVGIQL